MEATKMVDLSVYANPEWDPPDNAYFQRNRQLRNENIEYPYTLEQLIEIKKCEEDIIYFVKNYCKIVSLDDGLINFKLYDFQEEMIKLMHENNRVVSKLPRQAGKCVLKNTMIKVKNKTTGKIEELPIGDFYKRLEL